MTLDMITASGSGFHHGMTRRETLTILRQRLITANVATPGLDARLLCAFALGIGAAELLGDDTATITAPEAAAVDGVCTRRLTGESVARIVGTREFWGLPFRLSAQTLEPRPDTETLIEAVLEIRRDRQAPLRILDLGTGTGCILIALLSEFQNAYGEGTDIDPEAVATATGNATLNQVGARAKFFTANWLEGIEGRFDLITSNPPYIRSDVIGSLDREVRNFDPPRALDGGAEGLDAYRRIIAGCRSHLTDDGLLALEFGFDQHQAVEAIAADNDFRIVLRKADLAGHVRVVILSANHS